jgi:hypothetical protein
LLLAEQHLFAPLRAPKLEASLVPRCWGCDSFLTALLRGSRANRFQNHHRPLPPRGPLFGAEPQSTERLHAEQNFGDFPTTWDHPREVPAGELCRRLSRLRPTKGQARRSALKRSSIAIAFRHQRRLPRSPTSDQVVPHGYRNEKMNRPIVTLLPDLECADLHKRLHPVPDHAGLYAPIVSRSPPCSPNMQRRAGDRAPTASCPHRSTHRPEA